MLTHSLLCGARLGNELDARQARCLRDLVVDGSNRCSGIRCPDVDPDISDLPVETSRVHVVLGVVAIGTLSSDVVVGGEDPEADEARSC